MKNIVLIGMPGVGKTTVGELIAKKEGLLFKDTDREIERLTGKPIPLIIYQQGIEYFRNFEEEVIQQIASESGDCVIATGGGSVLRTANVIRLKENGVLFNLIRVPDIKDFSGRPPCRSKHDWIRLEHERRLVYLKSADYSIHATSAEKTAEYIISIMKGEKST